MSSDVKTGVMAFCINAMVQIVEKLRLAGWVPFGDQDVSYSMAGICRIQ